MLRIIGIESIVCDGSAVAPDSASEDTTCAFFFPGDDVRPLDTVLWLPWDSSQRAKGHCGSWGMHIKLTLNTRGHCGEDYSGLTFEAFRTTVNQRLQSVCIVVIYHANERSVDPAPRFDAVEAAYDHAELHIVIFILVLDLAAEGCYFNAANAFLYELSGHFSFGSANIGLSK